MDVHFCRDPGASFAVNDDLQAIDARGRGEERGLKAPLFFSPERGGLHSPIREPYDNADPLEAAEEPSSEEEALWRANPARKRGETNTTTGQQEEADLPIFVAAEGKGKALGAASRQSAGQSAP